MHICQLTRIVWEHGIHGGMEQHSRLVTTGLQKRGHRVLTLTTAGVSNETVSNVRFLPGTRPRRYSRGWWHRSAAAVGETHRRDPLDVVWSQSSGGLGYLLHARRSVGVPCVVTLHGTLESELKTRLRNLASLKGSLNLVRFIPTFIQHRDMWHRAAPLVDKFIAVSETVAQSAHRAMQLPLARIAVIPNGVDAERFVRDPALRKETRHHLDLPDHATVFIATGRLAAGKGMDLAIRTVAALTSQPTYLLIAGAGRDAARLRNLVQHSSVQERVKFLGFVPNEDLPAYYNAADIFMMPTRLYEGLPMSLLEAMACGLPVIATDIGGIPTAVKDGANGLLVPPSELAALQHAAESLTKEPSFARQLGDAARDTVLRRYSAARMVQEMEQLFDEVSASQSSV